MDGLVVDEEVQVLVMGATNRVDMLDPALLRPGRFDRVVNVDLPDKEGREMILGLHTRAKPLAPEIDLAEIARQTFGFSGAHLESLTNEAAILALRQGLDQIQMCHFVEAVDKVILGEKMDRKPSLDEKRRVAVHEGGHALVGEWSEAGSVATITITPRGRALGYVRTNPAEDHYLYTRPMLLARIRVALAGFLAEELIYGEGSTGASGDFQQVLEIARQILSSGMSDLGVIDPNTVNRGAEGEVIQRIIHEEQSKVRWFLKERQEVLVQVADRLMVDEVLSGSLVRELLAAAPALAPFPVAPVLEPAAPTPAVDPDPATEFVI